MDEVVHHGGYNVGGLVMHAGLRLRFFLLGSLARFLLFLGWLLALYGGVRGEKSLSIEHDVGR